MDLHMPGIDGFACTQALRALPDGAEVPIIAISANVLSSGRPCRSNNSRSGGYTSIAPW